MGLRGLLYKLARLLGDVNAVQKGKVGKRSPALSLIVLTLAFVLTACGPADSEREAMITFTRQALAIEATRDAALKSWGADRPGLAPGFFLGLGTLGRDFPSGPELKGQMLLLDCPPSLQGIKDSLVEAYRLEIEAAHLEGQRKADMVTGGEFRRIQFYPGIDRFNVDSFKKGELPVSRFVVSATGPWVMAQELRRDAYIKWAQLLQQHGIDPAKEGFTALALE